MPANINQGGFWNTVKSTAAEVPETFRRYTYIPNRYGGLNLAKDTITGMPRVARDEAQRNISRIQNAPRKAWQFGLNRISDISGAATGAAINRINQDVFGEGGMAEKFVQTAGEAGEAGGRGMTRGAIEGIGDWIGDNRLLAGGIGAAAIGIPAALMMNSRRNRNKSPQQQQGQSVSSQPPMVRKFGSAKPWLGAAGLLMYGDKKNQRQLTENVPVAIEPENPYTPELVTDDPEMTEALRNPEIREYVAELLKETDLLH